MSQQISSSSGSSGPQSFKFKYCRMCALELRHGGVLIFGEEGRRLHIPEKIRKTLAILVLEEDNLPKKICTDCCSSLEDYAKYKDIVVDAQEKLAAIARILPQEQGGAAAEVSSASQEENVISSSSSNSIPKIKTFQPSPSQLSFKRCEFCGKRFSTKISLDRHLSTEHSPAAPSAAAEEEEHPGHIEIEPDIASPDPSGDEIVAPNSNAIEAQPRNPTEILQDFPLKESPQEVREEPTLPCSSRNNSTRKLSRFVKKRDNKPAKKEEVTESSDMKNYHCSQCNKTFASVAGFYQHQNSVHRGRRFHCEQCPNSYSQNITLQNHILTAHQGQKPVAPAKGAFQCSQCPVVLSTKKFLRRHQQIHRTTRNFECPICHKFFKTSKCLSQHKSYHSPSKSTLNYSCSYCPKKFNTKYQLASHHNCHLNIRPIGCPFCENGFNCYSNYNDHVRRSHKEKIVDGKVPKPIKRVVPNISDENETEINKSATPTPTPIEKNKPIKEVRQQQELPVISATVAQSSIPIVPMHEMVNVHTSLLQSEQIQQQQQQQQSQIAKSPTKSRQVFPMPTTINQNQPSSLKEPDLAIAYETRSMPSSTSANHPISQMQQTQRLVTTLASNVPSSSNLDSSQINPQPYSSALHTSQRQQITVPISDSFQYYPVSQAPQQSQHYLSISATDPQPYQHHNSQQPQRPSTNALTLPSPSSASNSYYQNQYRPAPNNFVSQASPSTYSHQNQIYQRAPTALQSSSSSSTYQELNDLSRVVWTTLEESPLELCVRNNENDNDTNFNQLVDLTSDKIVDLSGVNLIGQSNNQSNNNNALYRNSLANVYQTPMDLTDQQQENLQGQSQQHQHSNLVDLSYTGTSSGGNNGGHHVTGITGSNTNNNGNNGRTHFQTQEEQMIIRELLDLSCSTSTTRPTATSNTIDSYHHQPSSHHQVQQQQQQHPPQPQLPTSSSVYPSYDYPHIQQYELNLSSKKGYNTHTLHQQYAAHGQQPSSSSTTGALSNTAIPVSGSNSSQYQHNQQHHNNNNQTSPRSNVSSNPFHNVMYPDTMFL